MYDPNKLQDWQKGSSFDQSQESQNPKVLKVSKNGKYRWFHSCLEFAWFSLAVTCQRYISILELRGLRQWRVQSFQTNVAIVSLTSGNSLWLKTYCIQLFDMQMHIRYLFDRRGPQQDSLKSNKSSSHSCFLALGTTAAILHVVNRWFLDDYGIIVQGLSKISHFGGIKQCKCMANL